MDCNARASCGQRYTIPRKPYIMDDHPGAGGRHKGVLKTQETLLPRDLDELIHCGGVAYIERVAATKASADATRSEREFWLPILEHCLAEEKAADKDEWPIPPALSRKRNQAAAQRARHQDDRRRAPRANPRLGPPASRKQALEITGSRTV